MFERFGEFDRVEEINEVAVNLRKEEDMESILVLAEENGMEKEIAEAFIEGDILYLTDTMSAAIGKIEVEAEELKPVEIIADWVEYIKARCFESEEMAKAVRKVGKSLKGCIAELLKWSFKEAYAVDKDITKMAAVPRTVKMGIPGMKRAKQIITEYYLGK